MSQEQRSEKACQVKMALSSHQAGSPACLSAVDGSPRGQHSGLCTVAGSLWVSPSLQSSASKGGLWLLSLLKLRWRFLFLSIFQELNLAPQLFPCILQHWLLLNLLLSPGWSAYPSPQRAAVPALAPSLPGPEGSWRSPE